MNNDEYIGYLKYTGTLVQDGILDARKAAQALIGFDDALRFFVVMQRPDLDEVPFEIPVKIQKGSWEALIPHNVGDWILASLGLASTAYLTTAATKLAENDFKNANLKIIFQKSIKAIQWVIRIARHLGSMSQKQIEKTKFEDNNNVIGIPNLQGEYLKVPREFLEWYIACPPKLLSKIAKLVESERELKIGINENGLVDEVVISVKEKYFFTSEDDFDGVLFPELVHGQQVELDGELTRGNEISNTLGFKYQEHILTCRPKEGSIVVNKDALFRKCKIVGFIDRINEVTGLPSAKKPKIIFSKIVPIENKNKPMTFLNE